MEEYDKIKWRIRLYRALNTLYCSGALALIVFVVLWLMVLMSGCASARDVCREPSAVVEGRSLSGDISHLMVEMERAGCWAKEVSVSYSGPTSYVISASGPYYTLRDKNREVK